MVDENTSRVASAIAERGFAGAFGQTVRAMIGSVDAGAWAAFGKSWSRLARIAMADGGYRRRRHAALALTGVAVRSPATPTALPERDYNPLNGGIERWFPQVQPEVLESACLSRATGAVPRCLCPCRCRLRD